MYFKQKIGKIGENIACKYLLKNNYEIFCRNYTSKYGEIDIVAKDLKLNELVFIEVKTRSNLKYGKPCESVDKLKKKHIYNCAKFFIYKNCLNTIAIRFDVIEIYLLVNENKINHIKMKLVYLLLIY